MAIDNTHSHGVDLDRTDRLPILEGMTIDEDVADDSVRLDGSDEPTAVSIPPMIAAAQAPSAEFARAGLDLPSLAESVRSVEERIARQNADYEALNRLYEKARDAQLAAGTRADALAAELSSVQSSLAVEKHRSREMERAMAEGSAASEASRARAEESAREADRHQTEARTLRDALAARDATIAQVLHSLGERDAQLAALQREQAQTVPVLEERSRTTIQLGSDLDASRAQVGALSRDLEASRDAVASLTAKLARGEAELVEGRRELGSLRTQAASYLEVLRTRDWRGGFNQNLFRDWDDKADAARSGHGALQAECERLTQSVAALSAKLAEQDAAMAKLQASAAASTAAEAAALARRAQESEEAQRVRDELHSRIDRLETERRQLQTELVTRGEEMTAVRTANSNELAEARAAQAAAEARATQSAAELERLRAESAEHEDQMSVLMAHLNEARRPIQSIQDDVKRLNEELALKSASLDQFTEENRTLRTSLERTRGALEERELHIRRLERSANNNANVLGRLQTSIERLGSAAPAALPGEFLAELIKIEGEARTAYPLGRRTRIGRAPGCELQIDSQAVSRHHAMLLKGTREIIIEDLNSTNGVLVNGRKVTRQVLSDGDLLTIGETHFQCRLKPNSRVPGAAAEQGAAASGAAAAATAADEDSSEGAVGPRGALDEGSQDAGSVDEGR
jgi:septal ring factor EnvC (AmiA/AmiB activator)